MTRTYYEVIVDNTSQPSGDSSTFLPTTLTGPRRLPAQHFFSHDGAGDDVDDDDSTPHLLPMMMIMMMTTTMMMMLFKIMLMLLKKTSATSQDARVPDDCIRCTEHSIGETFRSGRSFAHIADELGNGFDPRWEDDLSSTTHIRWTATLHRHVGATTGMKRLQCFHIASPLATWSKKCSLRMEKKTKKKTNSWNEIGFRKKDLFWTILFMEIVLEGPKSGSPGGPVFGTQNRTKNTPKMHFFLTNTKIKTLF